MKVAKKVKKGKKADDAEDVLFGNGSPLPASDAPASAPHPTAPNAGRDAFMACIDRILGDPKVLKQVEANLREAFEDDDYHLAAKLVLWCIKPPSAYSQGVISPGALLAQIAAMGQLTGDEPESD